MIGAATGMTTRKGTKQAPADPAAKLWTGSRQLTGNKTKVDRVDRSLKRREQMYALMEEHPESAEELAARVKDASRSAPLLESKLPRAVRKAEASAVDQKRTTIKDAVEDAGTGFTILKLRQKAIARLIDQKKIGPEERDAATQIELAVFAISSRLMVQSQGNFDRIDFARSANPQASDAAVNAVINYQRFAKVWSDRWAQYADPTLQIVYSAVIDELSIRSIADEIGYRKARIEQALICGLRDYAVRAGLVPNKRGAIEWQAQAEQVFGWRKKIPKDADPMERAAVNEARRRVTDDGAR